MQDLMKIWVVISMNFGNGNSQVSYVNYLPSNSPTLVSINLIYFGQKLLADQSVISHQQQ